MIFTFNPGSPFIFLSYSSMALFLIVLSVSLLTLILLFIFSGHLWGFLFIINVVSPQCFPVSWDHHFSVSSMLYSYYSPNRTKVTSRRHLTTPSSSGKFPQLHLTHGVQVCYSIFPLISRSNFNSTRYTSISLHLWNIIHSTGVQYIMSLSPYEPNLSCLLVYVSWSFLSHSTLSAEP